MDKTLLDLYSDYLLSSFGATTATGLSALLDGQISHDQVTRFLSQTDYTSKHLWQQVKSVVRSVEREDGVLIFDDTIQEKPHTDENELICWHFDHSQNRSVKGLNLLNCLYHAGDVRVPVAYELVRKPILFCDVKTRQVKHKSQVTKNQLLRQMLRVCQQNRLLYRYVLADSWFAAKDNLTFIRQGLDKHFIVALKANRTVALSEQTKPKAASCASTHWTGQTLSPYSPGSKDWTFLFCSNGRSLQTKTTVRACCIWPAATSTWTETPMRRSIRNDGKSNFFIKRSSPTPPWPSRPPNGSVPKAIMSSWPSMQRSR